jgi:hypothetical protein
MSKQLRPRYGRISAFLLSSGVTAFALLAGLGVFGTTTVGTTSTGTGPQASPDQPIGTLAALVRTLRSQTAHSAVAASLGTRDVAPSPGPTATSTPDRSDQDVALPADSGQGRRVVFDMSAQRVWLVGRHENVQRSYLVSGSVTDNLEPGHYAVYSRSRWAVGVDESGVMQYFVRFTRGNNAAIGFHDIPELGGRPLQTEDQLGTPQSHGCIRQARPDAIRLWQFAPVGTPVDVVA